MRDPGVRTGFHKLCYHNLNHKTTARGLGSGLGFSNESLGDEWPASLLPTVSASPGTPPGAFFTAAQRAAKQQKQVLLNFMNSLSRTRPASPPRRSLQSWLGARALTRAWSTSLRLGRAWLACGV